MSLTNKTKKKLDEYDIAIRELRAEVGEKEFQRRKEKFHAYRKRSVVPVKEQLYLLMKMRENRDLTDKDKEKISNLKRQILTHEHIAEAFFFKEYEYLVPSRDDAPEPDRNWLQQRWHQIKLDWYDWKDKLKEKWGN